MRDQGTMSVIELPPATVAPFDDGGMNTTSDDSTDTPSRDGGSSLNGSLAWHTHDAKDTTRDSVVGTPV